MTAAQVQSHLSAASFAKWTTIRRRMQAHDTNPLVIRPLKPMHRAILSLQYGSR